MLCRRLYKKVWLSTSKQSMLPLSNIKAQSSRLLYDRILCYSILFLNQLITFPVWAVRSSDGIYQIRHFCPFCPLLPHSLSDILFSRCQTFRQQIFKKHQEAETVIHPRGFISLFWTVKVQSWRCWHLRRKALCYRAAREAALLEGDKKEEWTGGVGINCFINSWSPWFFALEV